MAQHTVSQASTSRRVTSPVGGSGGMQTVDVMVMDKVSTVVSSAIASAGSAVVLALASERDRRDIAEKRLRELEMNQLMLEERGRYEAKIRKVVLECKTLEEELKQTSLLKVTLSISIFSSCCVGYVVMEPFMLQEKDSNLFNAQLKEKDDLLNSKNTALAAIVLERQSVADQCSKLQDDAVKLQQLKVCADAVDSIF